jgi:hypothetical protein
MPIVVMLHSFLACACSADIARLQIAYNQKLLKRYELHHSSPKLAGRRHERAARARVPLRRDPAWCGCDRRHHRRSARSWRRCRGHSDRLLIMRARSRLLPVRRVG